MGRWTSPFFLFFFKGWGDGHLHSSYASFGDEEMITSIILILPKGMEGWSPSFPLEEKKTKVNLRRQQKREGWPPPFLLFFFKGLPGWPHPFFLFFFKGWGDDHFHSSYVS